jgi:hypothetical protein
LSLHHSPEPPRRSRRLLLCGLTAAALIGVPGVARADTPLDPVTQQLEGAGQDLVDAVTGSSPASGAGSLGDVLPGAGTGTGTGTDPGAPVDAGGAASSLDPAQAQVLLGQLGVSPECATAIQADVEALVASVPATVEDLAAQLQTGLTDALESPPSSPEAFQTLLMGAIGQASTAVDPAGLPVLTAVQDLVTDFLATCLPKPAAAAPTTDAPVASAVQSTPTPVAAPAPTTPAAPVAYLGYAPTGAGEDEWDARTSLLALGAVLLLGGGLTGTWMRLRRGVPPRG